MADKEANVFIVDVGQSMAKPRNGRNQSDLDYTLRYIWDKLTNIVSMGRKTVLVGVIGLGTKSTDNHLQGDVGYEHLTEFIKLEPMYMPELRRLAPLLVLNNAQGDAMSAIVLAVNMIDQKCKHLKYKKRITLVTNGRAPMEADAEDLISIAAQIRDKSIELTVLGVDFDDAEYGVKEEDKPPQKAENEKLLKELTEQSEGAFGTMQEAIDGTAIPYVKPVRSVPTYRGQLTLGKVEQYDTALAIDVERYFKVMVKRPPTASSFVMRPRSSSDNDKPLQGLEHNRVYKVSDPKNPDIPIEISRDELAKGYEYGRTAVHIAESDENITKLETDMSYEILGFIPTENVERYLLLDNTSMLVAQRANDKAILALSSLIRALYINDSCAVGRFVKKDMSEPQLTLLTPMITDEVEFLIENTLPYAEDIRSYRFPPLDKILTVSGKSLATHRNLPDEKLLDAMSDFVDRMTLSDDDERYAIEETFSPVNFAVESAIKQRAVHPNRDVSDVPDSLLATSKPPHELLERNKRQIERLTEAADVKKVPPKVKGRRRFREREKPLSGLDVEALFKNEKREQISSDNAIAEFRQMVDTAESDAVQEDAMKQMMDIIRARIKNSFGDRYYDRVVEELGVLRLYASDYERPELFNDLMRQLKKDLLAESLGGNRKELWWRFRKARLGLIHDEETGQSSSRVTRDEAAEFMIPQ